MINTLKLAALFALICLLISMLADILGAPDER